MKKQTEKQIALFTGLTAALAASSGAATVQITLTGNQITTTGGNQLRADVTGDGNADITFSNSLVRLNAALVRLNGPTLYASVDKKFYVQARFTNGGFGNPMVSGGSPQNIKYLNPISFTDARINGGLTTNGYLEVNSFNSSLTNHSVVLTRVVFDDASITRPVLTNAATGQTFTEANVIPEPGSLALLALGAGGLLARRQRKAA